MLHSGGLCWGHQLLVSSSSLVRGRGRAVPRLGTSRMPVKAFIWWLEDGPWLVARFSRTPPQRHLGGNGDFCLDRPVVTLRVYASIRRGDILGLVLLGWLLMCCLWRRLRVPRLIRVA